MHIEPRPRILKSATQEVVVVSIISMCQFLNQAGILQCLSLMNIIADDFDNVTAGDKSWFMALFPLTVGTFIIISGRLGDIYGLKKIFLTGYIWLCIWSLIAGLTVFTKSVKFFIVCRAFQGLGFALSFPCGLGILGVIYKSGLRKNIVFGIYLLQAPVGLTLGALFAGIIGQLWWWPWAFWLLAIVLLVLALLSFVVVPKITPEVMKEIYEDDEKEEEEEEIPMTRALSGTSRLTLNGKPKMDWIGSMVGVAGMIIFNFVWNQAPVVGWHTSYIILLLVVSVILLAVFFYLELKIVENPLLPKSIFTKDVGLLLSSVFFGWGSFGIWTYYYWSLMMNIRHYTPILAAAYYYPLLIFGIIAAMLVSFTINKHVRASILLFLAMCGFFIGILLLALSPAHQTYYKMVFALMFLLAFGMDMSFPSLAISLSDYLPPEHQGMAGSLVSTLVNYSMSLCLGIGATAEQRILQKGGSVLEGYRAAMYVGVGLAGMSMLLSFCFVLKTYRDDYIKHRSVSTN